MTSTNRKKILTTELPKIRISPAMANALRTVAAQGNPKRGPRVGVSAWVRALVAQRLDEELPGWDE